MSDLDTNPELRARVESAPVDPGVYRFLDRDGRVLYVGKAKSLRKRVRSYFREGGDGRFLLVHLKREIRGVDFIVTATEKEALLLENTLIKRHRPVYNINFRDDKSFVSLRIDPESRIPRISVVRRPREDVALYFGPYSSSSAVRTTVKFIGKHFGVRPCSDGFYKAHTQRPCLKYQIGRCRAPCCGHVSEEEHRKLAADVALFLQGRSKELVRDLEREMKRSAEALEFERAASLRDQVAAIRTTIEGQIVTRTLSGDLDVVGVHEEAGRVELAVLFVRQGSLVSTRTVSFRAPLPLAEIISSFLSQYYGSGNLVPDAVVVPCEIPDREMIEALLSDRRRKKVSVHVAQRGERRRLLGLAKRNATASFRTRLSVEKQTANTLENLARHLGLGNVPHRIECFDISTLQGKETVASMVVFLEGHAERSEYRRFRIRESVGQDDFAAMAEVVRRRCMRLGTGAENPDLIVVDGGRGQVSAAWAVLQDLGLAGKIDLVGLAKARALPGSHEPTRSDERVFRPGVTVPIHLAQDGQENKLLVRLRDEAHRFAITYHRRLRGRAVVRSDLDAIPGIGPQRKRELLTRFGSLEGIRGCEVEELSSVQGVSRRLARRILEELARLAEEADSGLEGETGSETL